jgi:nickel/cobalt exporter
MSESLAVLVMTTMTTAVFHTLIPDHWLPFVLVARSQGWKTRKTLSLTAASATLHAVISVALGLIAHFAGRGAEAAVGFGESIERFSGWMLVAFGLAYALWFLYKGGHQHSFGMHPHHEPRQAHPPSAIHPHDILAEGASTGSGEGVRGRRRGGLALAAIVGFNPCLLVIPYIYLAGTMGILALVVVAVSFSLATIGCMVGVTLLGLRGTVRLESAFLMRYGEVVSGALILLTGTVVLLAGH